jgi:hypothetical protein
MQLPSMQIEWSKFLLIFLQHLSQDRQMIDKQGDQMSFVKNRPSSTHFLVKINTQPIPWEKVTKKFRLLRQFSQKLPKVNNGPMGENSPNLVTLFISMKKRRAQTS